MSARLRRACRPGGFGLLEVIIALALVALLTTLALPNYQAHLMRSHRTEARQALWQAAARLEQAHTLAGRYAQSNQSEAALADQDWLQAQWLDRVPPIGPVRYRIGFVGGQAEAQRYVLQARPENQQSGDACGVLLLSSEGQIGAAGVLAPRDPLSLKCWSH